MTDEQKTLGARRKLLKSLVVGGSATLAAKSLPEEWAKPVVESILLPAHGQTTQTTGCTWSEYKITGSGSFGFRVPPDVTELSVTLVGAAGGGGGGGWANNLTGDDTPEVDPVGGDGGDGGAGDSSEVKIVVASGECIGGYIGFGGSGGVAGGLNIDEHGGGGGGAGEDSTFGPLTARGGTGGGGGENDWGEDNGLVGVPGGDGGDGGTGGAGGSDFGWDGDDGEDSGYQPSGGGGGAGGLGNDDGTGNGSPGTAGAHGSIIVRYCSESQAQECTG